MSDSYKDAKTSARNKRDLDSLVQRREAWERRATDGDLQHKLMKDIASGEQYVKDELEAAYLERPDVFELSCARVIDVPSYEKVFGKYKGTKSDVERMDSCHEFALHVLLANRGKLRCFEGVHGFYELGDGTSPRNMKLRDQQLIWLLYLDSLLKKNGNITEPLRFVKLGKEKESVPAQCHNYCHGRFTWNPEM